MDGRDFETILTEYRPDLRPTNRRPRTIGNYERTLGRWRAWVESRADEPATVADVEKRHVAGYLDACRGHEAPETVLTGHRHLRAFFKWCEREEIIEKNPMRTMSEPTAPEQPPPVLRASSWPRSSTRPAPTRQRSASATTRC